MGAVSDHIFYVNILILFQDCCNTTLVKNKCTWVHNSQAVKIAVKCLLWLQSELSQFRQITLMIIGPQLRGMKEVGL